MKNNNAGVSVGKKSQHKNKMWKKNSFRGNLLYENDSAFWIRVQIFALLLICFMDRTAVGVGGCLLKSSWAKTKHTGIRIAPLPPRGAWRRTMQQQCAWSVFQSLFGLRGAAKTDLNYSLNTMGREHILISSSTKRPHKAFLAFLFVVQHEHRCSSEAK